MVAPTCPSARRPQIAWPWRRADLDARIAVLEADLREGRSLIERFDRFSMKGVDVDGDGFIEQYHVVPKTGNWHRLLAWARR
jgi:hypothetical protein